MKMTIKCCKTTNSYDLRIKLKKCTHHGTNITLGTPHIHQLYIDI